MKTESLVIDQNDGVETVPLMLLQAGQDAWVSDVMGDEHLVHRLREMGLYAGVPIRMIRPGNPCIIGLGRQRLGIRCDDLASIFVQVPAREY
jgi:ferrous iron transport protein A